jgi:hypothetical protein
VEGLLTELDTDRLEFAEILITDLQSRGRWLSLAILLEKLREVDKGTDQNIKYLVVLLRKIVASKPDSHKMIETSSSSDRSSLVKKYSSQEINPDVQKGVRNWISGDPVAGVNWKMVGDHLRGRLTIKQYAEIGYLRCLKEKMDTDDQIYLANLGRRTLEEASSQIFAALVQLDPHDAEVYRQAKVPPGVYGRLIDVGDYIADSTYWSTSALRISGSAGKWGTHGTSQEPKVYFIIKGISGKYISKQAQQEEGQHEVLFPRRAIFQVKQINNYFNCTLFVYLKEIDPVEVGARPVKNSYNGSNLLPEREVQFVLRQRGG